MFFMLFNVKFISKMLYPIVMLYLFFTRSITFVCNVLQHLEKDIGYRFIIRIPVNICFFLYVLYTVSHHRLIRSVYIPLR